MIYSTAYNGKQPGDPKKGVQVMIDVVHGEGGAAGKSWPAFLALGSDCYGAVKAHCEDSLKTLQEWKDVTLSTDIME